MEDERPIEEEKIFVESVTGEKPVIKVEPPQVEYEAKKRIIRERQIIWWALMVLESLLFIRFLLKLFGANPNNLFSFLVNLVSTPLTFLFSGLFPSTVSAEGNVEIEWSTLFAMLVYGIVAFLLARYFRLKKPINPKEAETKAEEMIP